ncbi:MAG TPA: fibronectin type III domain-containing protein, partial [Gemmataceae bacterium]|nr:fibronectin type III domain-containing protein [Gemmataceae bacterium]
MEPLEERCVPTMIVGLPTTDLNGVKYYSAVSDYQGNQPVILRTLAPTNPAPGMPHRFLYLLPVEPGLTTQNSQFGDGLEEARTLDLQDKYNCTLVAPSFNINPWYADNPNDTSRRLESFMVKDFVPWVDHMAAPGETPVRWLVGLSKSGFGGLGLIFRHPDVFSAIAAWDAPAQLSDVNTYSGTLPVLYTGMADNYGTQANFDTYRIPPLVANQNAPFKARNRIWISGDGVYFTPDMQTLDQQMTAAGVLHTFVGGAATRAHNWSSGWLPGAVQSLASATQFSVSAPASATAGTAFSIAVTALDGSNETVAGYRGTVHFTSTDTGAGVVLPADYTFTATDNGVHTFTNGATLVTAGSRTIRATDTGTASITGSQTGITVNPAAASTLVVAGFPSPITAGVAGAVAVTAKDPYGNTATSYAGTVHLTSSDAQAVLPVNSTLTNGTGSFSVTLKTAGQQSLTATDTVTASIAGSQTGISVNAAAASSLIVSGFPATTTAGTAGNFAVTAKDPYGNTATGYTGTVRFTSSDSQAALPANSTLTNGAGSFTATLKTAGAQSLTATDTVTATITGSQTGITVNPAAASTLVVAGFPSPVTAGTAATVTVTAKDAYGNTATGYTGTVRITSSDGQAVLPANSTLTNGTGPFTATLKTAGAQSLTATDTVTASITGSASVTVNPAAATHYQLAAPGSATAGSAFTVMLTALDQFNNIATAYQGKAHFTASDAGAGVVLPADYTFVAGDNGVHTFTNGVTLVTAGSPTITATDTVTASITGSASVTVNPDTSPPTAPSNLSAAESGFQINLSWTASTDNSGSVSGYFVERENPGSTTFVQIGTTTGTTYTDTGVAPNSTYSYRVRAEDTSGNLSGYSNVVGVTTPAALTVVGTPTVDANGVVSYSVVSPYLGAQTQTLRVLQPTHPSPGQPPR